MARLIAPGFETLDIPVWVVDFPSFLNWIHTEELPKRPTVHFIDGEPWVDYSMEETNSHNQLKAAIHSVLFQLSVDEDNGTYFPDGMRLTNEEIELSCEPDAMFATHETLDAGALVFRAGASTDGVMTEAVGTPDLVIEIISPSSEEKDTDRLFNNYFLAGIREYWLIDGRGAEPVFNIHKRGAKGFTPVRPVSGWIKSSVLGKSFKLSRLSDRGSIARFRLEKK